MITIDDVTKRYGTTTVVDRVRLDIPRGGVVSLIGANGAGKSTLLSITGRLLASDGGRVTIDGLDVQETPGPELGRRLSVLRQENHLPVRLTVRELVAFGRFPHNGGRTSPDDRDHIERAIDHLGLGPLAERRLDQLSGGQRQRAHIAMVLAQDTDFVLLDEPLNNLDLLHAAQSMAIIRRLADDFGKTVVVVLHDVNVAAHHSDRIIAMKLGRVVADGAPREILTTDVLHEIFDLSVDVAHVGDQPVAMHFAPTARAAPLPQEQRVHHTDHLDRRPAPPGADPARAAPADARGAPDRPTHPAAGPHHARRGGARRLLQRRAG